MAAIALKSVRYDSCRVSSIASTRIHSAKILLRVSVVQHNLRLILDVHRKRAQHGQRFNFESLNKACITLNPEREFKNPTCSFVCRSQETSVFELPNFRTMHHSLALAVVAAAVACAHGSVEGVESKAQASYFFLGRWAVQDMGPTGLRKLALNFTASSDEWTLVSPVSLAEGGKQVSYLRIEYFASFLDLPLHLPADRTRVSQLGRWGVGPLSHLWHPHHPHRPPGRS